MRGDDALREAIVVVRRPAELVDQCRERDARIGNASGEHDVGLFFERGDDRHGSEISVGREHFVAIVPERLARFHVVEGECFELGNDIVAAHDRYFEIDAARLRNCEERFGTSFGVDAARIRDDADPVFFDVFEQRIDLRHEVSCIARARIAGELFLQDAHRDLGEKIHRDVIDGKLAEYLPAHRIGIVTPIAAGIRDTKRCRSWHELHPEDADARLFDRCVQNRREAQGKNGAGGAHVHDTVIP